jgi:hypothetical protein
MSAPLYSKETPYFITVHGAGFLLHEVVAPAGRESEFFHNLLLSAQQCAGWQQLVEGRHRHCRLSDSSQLESISLEEELQIGLLLPLHPRLLQGHDLSSALCEVHDLTGMTMFRDDRLTLMLDTSMRWWEDQSACDMIRSLHAKGVSFGINLSNVTQTEAGLLLRWLHEGGLSFLRFVRLPVFLHRIAMKRLCAVKHIIDLVMRSPDCVLNVNGVTGPDDTTYLNRQGVTCRQGDVLGYHQTGEQVMAALRQMVEQAVQPPSLAHPWKEVAGGR